jgi:hypothetical protein
MPIRCKLGPTYVLSPAQRLEKWMINNISKLIFTLVIWALWFGVFFVFLGVVNFVGSNVGGMWDKEIPTIEFFKKPYSIAVYILGMIFIVVYVFYDKTSRRK